MSLAFAAPVSAIQSFVDRSLNAATAPGRFVAGMSYVFFAVMAAGEVGSATPPYSDMGTMEETDVGFWIPVQDTTTTSSYWFPAYLYVDNWLAVAGGREIWGFPKAGATLELNSANPSQGVIAVSTLAVKVPAPDARVAMAEIFRLTPGPSAWKHRMREGESLAAAMARSSPAAVRSEARKTIVTLREAGLVGGLSGPMIFLKQFRDAGGTEAACYQSVITANATATAQPGMGLLGNYVLTLADYASPPIASDLGLTIGDQTSSFGLWMDMDFTMELGTPV